MNSMEDLPPACRTVFSLTLEGYSAKEIAEKLDIAVETVKKQKQIARENFKGKIWKIISFSSCCPVFLIRLFSAIYFYLSNGKSIYFHF